jgi:sugar/nucleoside kinase (ribokinase family)
MKPAHDRRGVCAGGNWIVDHVKTIDAWPPQDALANILAQTAANGGSPYNLLKNLARLGAGFPLEGIGLVGDDADGRFILEDCRAHAIGGAQVRAVPGAATSYTDVMTVQGDGRRTFFHQRGANALLAPEHFDFARTRARHFHLGYALLLDALDRPAADGRPGLAAVLARARAAGLTTSLDCVSENRQRFRTVIAPVLPEVDVLLANDFEAEQLTGEDLGRGAGLRPAAVARAARALLAQGVREVVIIHFPEGAVAASAAGAWFWQPSVALPSALIAGTAGAGDALAAGLILGWHEGWPLDRGLELGVCAAAASLRDARCSHAVEAAAACLALGRVHGFRERPPGAETAFTAP